MYLFPLKINGKYMIIVLANICAVENSNIVLFTVIHFLLSICNIQIKTILILRTKVIY